LVKHGSIIRLEDSKKIPKLFLIFWGTFLKNN